MHSINTAFVTELASKSIDLYDFAHVPDDQV